jgi:hypothetical protein
VGAHNIRLSIPRPSSSSNRCIHPQAVNVQKIRILKPKDLRHTGCVAKCPRTLHAKRVSFYPAPQWAVDLALSVFDSNHARQIVSLALQLQCQISHCIEEAACGTREPGGNDSDSSLLIRHLNRLVLHCTRARLKVRSALEIPARRFVRSKTKRRWRMFYRTCAGEPPYLWKNVVAVASNARMESSSDSTLTAPICLPRCGADCSLPDPAISIGTAAVRPLSCPLNTATA